MTRQTFGDVLKRRDRSDTRLRAQSISSDLPRQPHRVSQRIAPAMEFWNEDELPSADKEISEEGTWAQGPRIHRLLTSLGTEDWTFSKNNPQNDRTLMSQQDVDALLDDFYGPKPGPGGSKADHASVCDVGTVANKKHLLGLALEPNFQFALDSEYIASIEDRNKSCISTSTSGIMAAGKEDKTEPEDEVALIEDPSWVAVSGIDDSAEESNPAMKSVDNMRDKTTGVKRLEETVEDGQTTSTKRVRLSSSMVINNKAPFRSTAQTASGLLATDTVSRRLYVQAAFQTAEALPPAHSPTGESLMDS
ncbi:unnamed protein product [Diplocarpon coronariae]